MMLMMFKLMPYAIDDGIIVYVRVQRSKTLLYFWPFVQVAMKTCKSVRLKTTVIKVV